eukprot:10030768-Lingulodinium_polyedra.AAC.1
MRGLALSSQPRLAASRRNSRMPMALCCVHSSKALQAKLRTRSTMLATRGVLPKGRQRGLTTSAATSIWTWPTVRRLSI